MNTIVWPPQPKILGSATNWKETKDLKKGETTLLVPEVYHVCAISPSSL